MSADRFEGLASVDVGDGLRVYEAVDFNERRRGLAKLDELPAGTGLHIHRCSSVHTVGMRFPLDLLWLDADGRVVRVDRDVPPRRLRGCRDAKTVIEINAGEADRFLGALGPGGYTGPR